MNSHPPIRQSCPPGTCTCRRDELLEAPGADVRILLLTRHEENRLLERLANVQSLEELERLQQRMFEQLGIRMRGIAVEFAEQPGLCRKTRPAIAAAVRRGLAQRPEIAWRLLDVHDLLGGL